MHVLVDHTVDQCARAMAELNIRHLVCVDAAGKLLGLIDDEAIEGAIRGGRREDRVKWIVRPADLVAGKSQDLIQALCRMVASHQDAIVVVNDTVVPIGIFTEHDALELADVVVRPWLTIETVMRSRREIIAVPPEAWAEDARALMTEHAIRHLLVLDHGRLVGVISPRDLVGRPREPVGDLVAEATWKARPDTPVHVAVRLMIREKVGCLPVIGPGSQPVGIVTRTDIVRAVVQQLQVARLTPGEVHPSASGS